MYVPRDYDGRWREPGWQRLYEEAGKDSRAQEIVSAFNTLYAMYTDDLVEWYANLYDPYIGGYYCTASGKANEGFLPDIESSKQAMNFIEGSGLADHAGGDWRRVVPGWMKEKFVRFAKRMQEPNGYFYNLLKTTDEIDAHIAKRGRDLSWCTWFLRQLGKNPTYDTPNGMKGDGLDCDGNPVADFAPAAVASERPAAATKYPEHLENRETFLRYLNDTVDIVGKSYYYGNQLNATYNEIRARDLALRAEGADYSLCDVLIEWLNERINPETGYWSPLPTFAGTNGFFKVITLYNEWGYTYPTLERAVESVIAGILGDEPTTKNSCEVYNLWSALISAKENAAKCYAPEEGERILRNIKGTMLSCAPKAILNTYRKQSGYQMPDGAFSHGVERCMTSHQGGIQVGLGLKEGDVDAISRGTYGITSNMFRAFGFTEVKIYGKREWKIYRSILESAKPVVKTATKTYR